MPPSTPAEDHTTYPNPPYGYAPATTFSASLEANEHEASTPTPSSFPSPDAEDFFPPMTTPYPTLTSSSSANQDGHGYQYPPPSSFSEVFGTGHFTYDNSDAFTPSIPDQGGRPAHWDQTQPPEDVTECERHDLPAPATPQAYDASSSVVDAEKSPPRHRPCPSIAPNLGTEAQDQSPEPNTQGLGKDDIPDFGIEHNSDSFFGMLQGFQREGAESPEGES